MTDVLSAKLDEMLAGLEGLPGGPWYYDVPDPGYTYDFVKTRHPDFAPTPQDRFRNQIAETDGATRETQKIGKHIARCDPDTMRQIITLAKQALSLPITAEPGEVVDLTKRMETAARNVERHAKGKCWPGDNDYDDAAALLREGIFALSTLTGKE